MELLRDRSAEFEQGGVRVFGVSRDSPWTHISWAQVLDLNFPLLSDWNADAVHAFDIAHEHRGPRRRDAGGEVERGGERYKACAARSSSSKSGTSAVS